MITTVIYDVSSMEVQCMISVVIFMVVLILISAYGFKNLCLCVHRCQPTASLEDVLDAVGPDDSEYKSSGNEYSPN